MGCLCDNYASDECMTLVRVLLQKEKVDIGPGPGCREYAPRALIALDEIQEDIFSQDPNVEPNTSRGGVKLTVQYSDQENHSYGT